MYFSFFGEVISRQPSKRLAGWMERYSLAARVRGDTSWNPPKVQMPAIPRGWQEVFHQSDEPGSGSTSATAYQGSGIPRDAAVLIVENGLAGWANVGLVKWPIEFTAPAAIAGACCAPRYGLAEPPTLGGRRLPSRRAHWR